MPTTWAPLVLNEVYANVGLTTAEDTVTVQCAPLTVGATYPGSPEPVIQLRSDVPWLYAYATGGPYTPVQSNESFNYRVLSPFSANVLYVKAATGPGTLYGLRVK